MPEWIVHPQDWGIFALVAVAAVVVVYALWRVALGGTDALRAAALPSKTFRRVLLPAARGAREETVRETTDYSVEAIALACRLARSGGASLLLTYIIEVPRNLAPNAPMEEAETEARRALDEAAETARSHGLQPITQIRKARAAADETLRAIADEDVDLLVLMAPSGQIAAGTDASRLSFTTELARRAPCEVVLARTAQV